MVKLGGHFGVCQNQLSPTTSTPSAAAASQPAQRAWPAVGDEVEADWSGEGEGFDGRVTRERTDGTARARPGRSSALRILHSKSGLVWDF